MTRCVAMSHMTSQHELVEVAAITDLPQQGQWAFAIWASNLCPSQYPLLGPTQPLSFCTWTLWNGGDYSVGILILIMSLHSCSLKSELEALIADVSL
jgi:hypothetical protein